MKHKLIKIAVIFIVVMILFTILSRISYNASSAVVETTQPVSKAIGPEVETQGIVEEKQEIAVGAEENQLVKTVCVTVGEAVEKEQVLYKIDMMKLEEQMQEKRQELELADIQIQSAQAALQAAQDNKQLMQTQAQADYDRASMDGDYQIQMASEALEQARSEYDQYMNQPEVYPEVTEEELSRILSEKQSAYDAAVKSKDDALYAAQKAIDSANVEDNQNDSTIRQTEISKEQIQKKLDKLQSLKDGNGEIKAPAKGVITEITVKAGTRTSGGGDILLADVSAGMKVTAVFQEDAKKYIQRGTKVGLKLTGDLAHDSKEKLSNLIIDSVSENEGKEAGISVTVNLPANTLDFGMTPTLVISVSEQNYDTCIPLEALNMGEKGKYYVNVVEKTKTVLGEEWVVYKTNVELLNKDEKYAAVQGITNAQEIVTKSSRILDNKMHVKRVGK